MHAGNYKYRVCIRKIRHAANTGYAVRAGKASEYNDGVE
jgi:hypothetical protein